MKTVIMDCVKTLDETIPDATMDLVIDKCDNIHKDVKAAFVCYTASMIMSGFAIMETAELTAILSKSIVKRTLIKFKEKYDETVTTITIRR